MISLALSAALVMSLMTGCGTNPQNAESTTQKVDTETQPESTTGAQTSDEKVELTLWVTSRKTDDYTSKREEAFLAAHPNITFNKVVKEGDPGNEFYQGVAVGNAPDVVDVSFAMMDKYMKAGILEPLNTYADNWDEYKNFTKEYTDMGTLNNNLLGIPFLVGPVLFAYNKSLFKDAGLEGAPKTWEEALEFAKKINDPNKQITGYATLTAEWTEWFFQYYVWQAGGDLTKQNEDGTIELTFDDPAVIEAANYYQKLSAEGVLQSDRTLKFTDLTTAFGQGRIGMMPFAGDWVSDAIKQGIDPEDIGLCLPPAGPGGSQSTAIGGSCYVINAKSSQAKKDAAWEYIKYNTSNEGFSANAKYNASKGAANPITIPRDDMNISDFYEFPQEYNDVLEAVKSVGRLEFYGKADFGSYIDKAVQKILSDPNSDPATEFMAAQKLAESEALEKFNEEAKTK